MRSIAIIGVLALSLCACVLGQPDVSLDFEVTWGNTGNEDGFVSAVSGDGSGNIYIAGWTNGALGTPSTAFLTSNAGGYDGYVLKYNNKGVQQWMRVFQTNTDDQTTAIASDISGNVYVGGQTKGYLQTLIPYSINYYDSYIAKYDSNGIQTWFVPIQVSGNDDFVNQIVVKDSFIYILGTYMDGSWYPKVYLQKRQQSDGALLWSVTWGANQYEYANGLHVDANNYIYVVGDSNSNIPPVLDGQGNTIPGWNNAGWRDGFLIVFDSNTGSKLLNIPIQSGGQDVATAVTTDGLGGIYVTGGTDQPLHGETYSGTSYNQFLVKYQVTGTMSTLVRQWTRLIGSTNGGKTLSYDGVGGLYVVDTHPNCMSFSNNMFSNCASTSYYWRTLRKFDTNGNLIWSYTYPGNVQSASLSANGILVTTGSFSTTLNAQLSKGQADGFLRQQIVNYNCSCSDLASLVNEVQGLLNIAPVF